MDIKFLAIDGFNLVRRIFEARRVLVPEDMAAVVEAVVASTRRALEIHKPTHAAMVFELHDRTWRHLLYPEYKHNRKPPPPILLDHIPSIEKAVTQQTGVACCSVANYEADDVIATMVSVVAAHGGSAIVLSTDKSYLQLVSPQIVVHDHFKDRKWTQAEVEQELSIRLEQVIDYFALIGHKSNDVSGVPGIGPKSAVELLASFGSLEDMLAADPETADRLVKKVQLNEAEAIRARQLVKLKTDVELGHNLKSFRLSA